MARYRKISPSIWNDAKFRYLSDNGKLVFFMLLTHPQTTALGTLRAYPQGLAPELGWSEKAFREAFREGIEKGMVMCSEKAGLIWLPNFLKHNTPENPNVLKSWAGALDDCPECDLKIKVYERVKALAEGFGEAFAKAFRECFAVPLPNQEQEQEQEQEIPLRGESTRAREKPAPPPKRTYGEFGNVSLTDGEYTSLVERYGEQDTAEAIKFLDLHLGAQAKKDPYKSHYLAMQKWVFTAVEEQRRKLGTAGGKPYPSRASPSPGRLTGEDLTRHNMAVAAQVMAELEAEKNTVEVYAHG